jgi:PBP1b-binding outer membrane lipoprotein LpoB
MKNKLCSLLLLAIALLTVSCNNYETYSDKKKQEADAINRFIAQQGIQEISEAVFEAQGQTTDLASNQFVRFTRNGVYMQIIRKGCGSKLEENKKVTILCRFMEKDIQSDTVLIRNDREAYITMATGTVNVTDYLDKMTVTRKGTTITASFTSGLMATYHGSQSVPAGWLVPLNYINIGRPDGDDDETAKVRLIVPHSQGTADASSSVIPFYYEISYERER